MNDMFEYTTELGFSPKINNLQQFLIWKNLKEPSLCNWPNQIKIASKIIKVYSNPDFWTTYFLGFKLNSLAYFLTKDGKKHLFLSYNRFLLDNLIKVDYSLGEKVGEDRKFDKKKTLREFLT
jgi:hypothetical protein